MLKYLLCIIYFTVALSAYAQDDRTKHIERLANERLENDDWTSPCKHSIHTEEEVKYLLNISRQDIAQVLFQRDPIFFPKSDVLINEDVMELIGYYLIKQNNPKLSNFATRDNLYNPAKRKYFPLFEKHFNDYHTPRALLLLPVAETDLREDVISGKGAAGLWQFMPGTAEEYGIVYEGVDLRTDIDSSTDAACRYLRDMHDDFFIWPLTVLGYHGGDNSIKNMQDLYLQDSDDWTSHWSSFWDELSPTTQCHLNRLVALNYIFEIFDRKNILNK